ncbi:MAG: hypothetical protein NTY08_11475 [Proteobacteria bacterium]|nr:hypothetical protein [Pseudomonadota bacterium]
MRNRKPKALRILFPYLALLLILGLVTGHSAAKALADYTETEDTENSETSGATALHDDNFCSNLKQRDHQPRHGRKVRRSSHWRQQFNPTALAQFNAFARLSPSLGPPLPLKTLHKRLPAEMALATVNSPMLC